ncbi:YbgA family protein [Aliidiomarina indica]|uniref:YbgA family protein n=1 Tax=Aliidiomarina indica TaxID=2749147 RepID=UPI00188E2C7E
MIFVGISACLLGQKVRYDGGHKASSFCQHDLGKHVEYLPLCPEVGIGMSVPRPTIRLVGDADAPHAVVQKTGENVTSKLAEFARIRERQLRSLSGYVLCAKSPSCGMERVRVYDEDSNANKKEGVGIFAAELKRMFPALPMEEDGRLNDPLLRENFVLRLYVYHDWQSLPRPLTMKSIYDFHARHKLLLLAHDQPTYRRLGRELAETNDVTEAFTTYYIETLMHALSKPASRRDHTNVLQHVQGYFSKELNDVQRQELTEIILQYRRGEEPLAAPLTLMNSYLRQYPDAYLQSQSYFNPYPHDLKLRYGL